MKLMLKDTFYDDIMNIPKELGREEKVDALLGKLKEHDKRLVILSSAIFHSVFGSDDVKEIRGILRRFNRRTVDFRAKSVQTKRGRVIKIKKRVNMENDGTRNDGATRSGNEQGN